jgi:xylulokinase
MTNYLVGIDVGTTGSKAMVLDLAGNVMGSGYGEYSCLYPKQNWVVQDAELVIQKTFAACKEAVQNSGVAPAQIASVGFSTQRATFMLLDEDKQVLDGILYGWQDNRGASELEYITSKIPAAELYKIAGMPVTPTFSLEKIIWIMHNTPEKYRKARYIAQLPDYVMYRFGAADLYGDTNAGCTGMIDLKNLTWSQKILDIFNIDAAKLPKLVSPGTVIGKVSPAVAEKTGLLAGTVLSSGTGDQQCAAIGAGVVQDGYASLTLGTAGLLVVGAKEIALEKSPGLMVTASGSSGLYELEGIQLGAASSYRWARDVLAGLERGFGGEIGLDPYNLMEHHINKSPVGANGVLFMPFLMGSGYPYWDSEAKGLFAGLKFSNTKSDLIRAVMEGITLESKDMYETIKASGVVIKSLAITGGATKSAAWRQIIADMFNAEIRRLKVSDATIIGAAVLAGVGAQIFKDAAQGVAKMVSYTDVIKPISENVVKYDEIYQIYRNLYEALAQKYVYRQLSALAG